MNPALRLFGSPQIRHKEGWRLLATNQLTLLAAYLAFAETWVSRDELLLRFWPDAPEAKARRNLNQLTYQLRKQAWASNLESNTTHVRLKLSTDLQIFREAITDSNWAEASHLYKAELLAGSFQGVSSNFEAWLETERNNLAKAWQDASLRYANALALTGQYMHALELLEDLLKRDPLAEDVLQIYLSTALKAKQPKAAIRVFESFQDELATELDLQPSDTTLDLFAKVKSDLATPTAHPKASAGVIASKEQHRSTPQFNVPEYSSAFVGRDAELNELASLLRQADCRLITILGWGGMGKTRLAVKAMLEHKDLFKDGVAFVSLISLTNEADIVREIIRVLKLDVQTNSNLRQQLLSYLAHKNMLLLIDNFEHLTDHAGIVLNVVSACPDLRILVTSREALNFQGEQLLELRGLGRPEHADELAFEQHASVQLFLNTARRTGSFRFSKEDYPSLLRICAFLEGMPLAIELAAQWSRLLSIPEILEELETNLDFLESQQQDRPDRQQSIRRVFSYSWQLLSKGEQDALTKLAILKGSFNKEAAQAITGISLRDLFSLLNKSMLEQQDGLLTRHPLVYEFSFEKLLGSGDHEALQVKLASYYFDLAEQLKEERPQAFSGLAKSHESLVETLSYLASSNPKKALRFLLNLAAYWELRAYYKELSVWLTDLLKRYINSDALRAEACLLLAKHALWQSNWEDAQRALAESLSLTETLSLTAVQADALHSLGQLHFYQGDYREANVCYEQSLALHRGLEDSAGVAQSLTSLGVIAKDQGHYGVATKYYQESLNIRKKLQDKHGVATAQNNLGIIAKDQGYYQKAISLYQQSLALREELQDQRGIAQCLLNLGLIALHQQGFIEAKRYLEKSLQIEQQIGNIYGESLCLNTLANLATDQQAYAAAEALLNDSLELKIRLADQRGIAFTKHSLGFLHREQDNYLSAAAFFEQSLSIFQSLADQRGCLVVIADSITLFALTENPTSLSLYQSCKTLCVSLSISLAPRSWNKTQKSIKEIKTTQANGTLKRPCSLDDLVKECNNELELTKTKYLMPDT